jgi:hypothetical protein
LDRTQQVYNNSLDKKRFSNNGASYIGGHKNVSKFKYHQNLVACLISSYNIIYFTKQIALKPLIVLLMHVCVRTAPKAETVTVCVPCQETISETMNIMQYPNIILSPKLNYSIKSDNAYHIQWVAYSLALKSLSYCRI